MVMWSEPAMRAPLSGWAAAYSVRVAIRPGISVSAMAISLRPKAARPMSATAWSAALVILVLSRLWFADPLPAVGAWRNKHISKSLYASDGATWQDARGANLLRQTGCNRATLICMTFVGNSFSWADTDLML